MKKEIMKLFVATILLFIVTSAAMSQAKKPTIMVVPSDAWCNTNGYMTSFDNQGTIDLVPNYKLALQSNTDLLLAIAKINTLMADRHFPLKDLESTLKSVESQNAEDNLTASKSTGASLAESPVDRLNRVARADIILQLTWTVNTTGPKKSVTYNIQAIDAYTHKQVAGAQGTGAPSFSAELPVLLEEAVLANMDNFCQQLQAHFEDIFANGREVSVDIRVWDNSDTDLETEYDGTELAEIIDDWMASNTVNHIFTKTDASENQIRFEQVRIPVYRENGAPMDAEHFTRALRTFLRNNYKLQCKVMARGLGRCILIIGEK